jgi:hypothetical protein
MSVPIDGGTAMTIVSAATLDAGTASGESVGGPVGGIAVDATNVYWTSRLVVGSGLLGPEIAPALMRTAITGGTPTTLASETPATEPAGSEWFGVAVDSNNIYWTDIYDGVLEMPLSGLQDGGSPITLASGDTGVYSLAVSSTSVYWNTGNSAYFMSAPIGGGTAITLISGYQYNSGPQNLAVNATTLYWGNGTSVMSLPIGGVPDGGVPTTLASGQANPFSVALDSTDIYWTNEGSIGGTSNNGSVVKVSFSGGTPTILATGQNPRNIAVDSTSVYWTNLTSQNGGSVMKVAK